MSGPRTSPVAIATSAFEQVHVFLQARSLNLADASKYCGVSQSFYQNPLQMLNEALNLVNWKNNGEHIDQLVQFQYRVKAKVKELRQGRKKRKALAKTPITEKGRCYVAFKKWARQHGVRYSPDFYKNVWTPCFAAGMEPVWEEPVSDTPERTHEEQPDEQKSPVKAQVPVVAPAIAYSDPNAEADEYSDSVRAIQPGPMIGARR